MDRPFHNDALGRFEVDGHSPRWTGKQHYRKVNNGGGIPTRLCPLLVLGLPFKPALTMPSIIALSAGLSGGSSSLG
jgi:hypothetical protein